MGLRLNCDLGESAGSSPLAIEVDVMPYIDQANIACGFHAGDPLVMRRTLALAKANNVMVGAHPGYLDLVGFGRQSMDLSAEEIIALMHYQIGALEGVAQSFGVDLAYVKPHGALYNDMMVKPRVWHAILSAISSYHRPLTLMIQATPQAETHRQEARDKGVVLWFEAFADRCYDDDGHLLSRDRGAALHDQVKILAQVKQLRYHGSVTTISGNSLPLQADSLCVHGDNSAAVKSIQAIRHIIGG